MMLGFAAQPNLRNRPYFIIRLSFNQAFMFTRDKFRQVKRLKFFLEEKAESDQWLFIAKDDDITLDILCLAIRKDFDEFDSYVEQLENNQFCYLLSTAQLESIVQNLRLQKSVYRDTDLLAAVKQRFKTKSVKNNK